MEGLSTFKLPIIYDTFCHDRNWRPSRNLKVTSSALWHLEFSSLRFDSFEWYFQKQTAVTSSSVCQLLDESCRHGITCVQHYRCTAWCGDKMAEAGLAQGRNVEVWYHTRTHLTFQRLYLQWTGTIFTYSICTCCIKFILFGCLYNL